MALLKAGDTVALVGCSNGLSLSSAETINKLEACLQQWGLKVIKSPYIYVEKNNETAGRKKRAEALMACYRDEKVRIIFDVSGGDLANEVLTYLDYKVIKAARKPYVGYSDLTTVINALYAQTGLDSYLYQVRFLVDGDASNQQQVFYKSFFEENPALYEFEYEFVRGEQLTGIVLGGNIRCLLKLAGTPYFPNMADKVLFLESRSGQVAQMRTFLNQYEQMGIFRQIKGILLGTFTQMEENELTPCIEDLVEEIVGDRQLPIVKTKAIGHGQDSRCLRVGAPHYFKTVGVALI